MRKSFCLFAVLASAAAGSGCATIVHGVNQRVTISSDPPGAEVTILRRAGDAAVVLSKPGVTPLEVTLPRRDSQLSIRLRKKGCEPATIRMTRSISGWTFTNLFFANPLALQGASSASAEGLQYVAQLGVTAITMLVDFRTGGAFNLPPRLYVPLCAGGG